jgi:hypothetical protein
VIGGTWTINTTQAAAPTFLPASPFTGGPQVVTASTATAGCGAFIYFDSHNPPTTNQTTVSFAASGNLYAYVHGCPNYTDSAVSTWTGTLSTLSAPGFSPQGSPVNDGYFLTLPTVTLSLPAGATGCYTTDGSTPAASTPGTCSNGTTYSVPFAIPSDATVLKAIATKAAFANSGETDQTYYQRAFVLDSNCSYNGGPAALTTASCSLLVGSGDAFISCAGVYGSAVPVATISDSRNAGSYSAVNPFYYGSSTFASGGRVFIPSPAAGSTTITMTLSSVSNYIGLACEAVKPASPCSAAVDTAFTQASPYPNATTGATANPSVASATPGHGNEWIYGSLLSYSKVPTAGSGFNLIDGLPLGPNLFPEYQVQTTPAATTIPFTMAADPWQEQPAGIYCVLLPPTISGGLGVTF